MRPVVATLWVLALGGCGGPEPVARAPSGEERLPMGPMDRTDAQWKAELSPEVYHVTREKGTERAFTGAYWKTKTPGTYRCACCGAALFASDAKFESGTGWPSFTAAHDDAAVATEQDGVFGLVRTEAQCSRCGAHLGHVFDDGPGPTGQRYCINSASLKLEQRPPSK